MFRKILLTLATATLLSASLANASAQSRNVDREGLRAVLRPHFVWQYPFITQAMRNATGDPDITVIDRRQQAGFDGRSGRCFYWSLQGKRVLRCE